MERLRTGIVGLDRLLQGGLPKGSVTLVIGPPGSGKSLLAKQFLYEGLRHSEDSILMSSSESLETVRQITETFGWQSLRPLSFIDCYSWKLGVKSPEAVDLTQLTEVSIKVSQAIEPKNMIPASRFVFDSFTDVLLNNEIERAIHFLSTIQTKLTRANVTGMIVTDEGLHDEKTLSAIEYICSGTIRMKLNEKGRYLAVRRMMATPAELKWVQFKISTGTAIKVEEFFR